MRNPTLALTWAIATGKSLLDTFIKGRLVSSLRDPKLIISSSDNPTVNCPLITPTVAGIASYIPKRKSPVYPRPC